MMAGKLRLVLGLAVVVVAAVAAGSAAADPMLVPVCPGESMSSPGMPLSGTVHGNLTISGNNYVDNAASLTVTGNLTLAPGACLDAFSMGTVNVGRNVLVGRGAILGLGCALDATFPPSPCTGSTDDTVGGNVVANNAMTMYLTALSVGGNVVSNGGGPGLGLPFVNFPIKDSAIGGNLIVQGWHGGWFGALRNTVHGNLIFSRNQSVLDPDAGEVGTNTVSGNLICQGNSPAVQFGDSGAAPNLVHGNAIGQCGFNVILPDPYYGDGGPQPISIKTG
jgi:hypothetical protein